MHIIANWYKATVYLAHVGAGSYVDGIIYLYARGLVEAKEILLRRARGWKRQEPYSIEEVPKEEYDGILDLIKESGLHSFNVKNKGYFYTHRK